MAHAKDDESSWPEDWSDKLIIFTTVPTTKSVPLRRTSNREHADPACQTSLRGGFDDIAPQTILDTEIPDRIKAHQMHDLAPCFSI